MAGTQKKPAQFYLILVHIMCQIKYMHKVGFYQGGTETPFSYWQSKNNYFYVMCLFYVKWPKNHFFINDISLSGAPEARFS